jgi:hypothetical protein
MQAIFQRELTMKSPRIPAEIESRLIDVGIDPRTVNKARVVEECQYVAGMLREGGSNYDDSPAAERRALRLACEKYIEANT